MEKCSNITVRLSSEVKYEAATLFAGLGMTLNEAVNLFLRRAIEEGGMPFEMDPYLICPPQVPARRVVKLSCQAAGKA